MATMTPTITFSMCRLLAVAVGLLCIIIPQVFGEWKDVYPENGFSGLVSLASIIGSPKLGVTLSKCYTLCLADLDCMSFFHNKDTKTCQLHSKVFMYNGTLAASTGFEYYRLDDDHCDKKSGYMLNRRLKICFALFPHDSPYTLDTMQAYCRGVDGGRMMMIDSMAKNDLVGRTAQTDLTMRWIYFGLTRRSAASTTWIWSNGKTLSWNNWYLPDGEPKMMDIDLCVHVHPGNSFGWNDRTCSCTCTIKDPIFVACEH